MNKAKKKVLLSKYENLLIAVAKLEDHPDLGVGSLNKINQIKNKVEALIENINRFRKKANVEI